jgi:hypothetical protein
LPVNKLGRLYSLTKMEKKSQENRKQLLLFTLRHSCPTSHCSCDQVCSSYSLHSHSASLVQCSLTLWPIWFFFLDRVSLLSPGWCQVHDPLASVRECWPFRCAPTLLASLAFFRLWLRPLCIHLSGLMHLLQTKLLWTMPVEWLFVCGAEDETQAPMHAGKCSIRDRTTPSAPGVDFLIEIIHFASTVLVEWMQKSAERRKSGKSTHHGI